MPRILAVALMLVLRFIALARAQDRVQPAPQNKLTS
jgi:hypothetical protein